MHKLVERKILDEFRLMIKTEKSRRKLLEYFDNNIMKAEKESLNDLKREIYISMKKTEGKKNQKLYGLYQDLKAKRVDLYEGWEQFIKII